MLFTAGGVRQPGGGGIIIHSWKSPSPRVRRYYYSQLEESVTQGETVLLFTAGGVRHIGGGSIIIARLRSPLSRGAVLSFPAIGVHYPEGRYYHGKLEESASHGGGIIIARLMRPLSNIDSLWLIAN